MLYYLDCPAQPLLPPPPSIHHPHTLTTYLNKLPPFNSSALYSTMSNYRAIRTTDHHSLEAVDVILTSISHIPPTPPPHPPPNSLPCAFGGRPSTIAAFSLFAINIIFIIIIRSIIDKLFLLFSLAPRYMIVLMSTRTYIIRTRAAFDEVF